MMLRRAFTSELGAFPRVAPARPRIASRANLPFLRQLPPDARANARFYWENRRQYDGGASSGSVVGNDPVNGTDPTGLAQNGGGDRQEFGTCGGSRPDPSCRSGGADGFGSPASSGSRGNLLMPQGNGVPRGGDTMATHQADIDDVRAAQGDLSSEELADRREARAIGASTTLLQGARLTISTTAHGAERLAGAAATRGGVVSTSEYWAARLLGKRMTQSDGASVFVRQHLWGGRSDFIVLNRDGQLITSGSNWSQKAISRISTKHGWK